MGFFFVMKVILYILKSIYKNILYIVKKMQYIEYIFNMHILRFFSCQVHTVKFIRLNLTRANVYFFPNNAVFTPL